MNAQNNDVIESYNRHADLWQSLRSQSLFEQRWLDKFSNLMPVSPSVLDLGCGSGVPIACYLSQNGAKITGVDGAARLIEMAAEQIPDSTWINADFRGLDLQRKFDGILGWHSTFHLNPDEQRAMFSMFRAHAKQGAALMFTTGTELGEVIDEFGGEPIYYASLSSDEYHELLVKNCFELIEHVQEDPTCGNSTIWLARFKSGA